LTCGRFKRSGGVSWARKGEVVEQEGDHGRQGGWSRCLPWIDEMVREGSDGVKENSEVQVKEKGKDKKGEQKKGSTMTSSFTMKGWGKLKERRPA